MTFFQAPPVVPPQLPALHLLTHRHRSLVSNSGRECREDHSSLVCRRSGLEGVSQEVGLFADFSGIERSQA